MSKFKTNLDIKKVDIKGKKMAFIRSGEGKMPIFLLHGWPVTKESFALVLPFLDEKFEAIIPDFPGFGESAELDEKHTYDSMSRAIIGLMDELKIEKAIISGMSMGAGIALELARKFPHRVERLIINSPPVYLWSEISDSQKKFLKIAEKLPIVRVIMYECLKHAVNLFSTLVLRKNINEKKNIGFRFMIGSVSRSGIKAPWEMLEEFTHADLRPNLSKIFVPTKVFVGLTDVMFINSAKEITKSLFGARVEYLDGGHNLVVKNPQLWADQINYA